MSKYTSSVLHNQVSIFDIIDNHWEETVNNTSGDLTAIGTDDCNPAIRANMGDCFVLPNWNDGFRQTRNAVISYVKRMNPKSKQIEQIPAIELTGELLLEQPVV